MSGRKLLVPVSETGTLRQTVEYAVSRAIEDGPGTVRFVVVHPPDVIAGDVPATDRRPDTETADELLGRAEIWAEEDAGDDVDDLTVETNNLGLTEYMFSPEDVARELNRELVAQDLETVVLDPEYNPGIGSPLLRPLANELEDLGISYEIATVTRPTRRGPFLTQSSPLRLGATFAASMVFYLLLAPDPFYWFELVTGVMAATIVTVSMSRLTFSSDPDGGTVMVVLRHLVYIPYLLWEILVSNIVVAAVILRPSAPIDPRLTRIRPAVWGSVPVTVLANSITLTPGTLTVRVRGDTLYVHTLLPGVRQDLFDGGLERAVRFVFYGRDAMAIPTPEERGDAENLQPEPAADGGQAQDEREGER
jgi:multicomponent Na+:H+ antiporter subunit E